MTNSDDLELGDTLNPVEEERLQQKIEYMAQLSEKIYVELCQIEVHVHGILPADKCKVLSETAWVSAKVFTEFISNKIVEEYIDNSKTTEVDY